MVYGLGMSEDFLGKALKVFNVRRDDIVINTKILASILNPHDILKAVSKSLPLLRTGYIDVLLAHRPPCWHNYLYVNMLELWRD